MTDRMTDERLSELLAIQDALGEMLSPGEWELGRAMKAERKSLNDCARDNTKFRQRIRELEAAINDLADRWVGYADQLEDEDKENHFVARAYRACAEELQEALADD